MYTEKLKKTLLLAVCAQLICMCAKPQKKIERQWVFKNIEHNLTQNHLNSVYARSNGDVFVAGRYGVVLYKPYESQKFTRFPSFTKEHLYSFTGVENGDSFLTPPQKNNEKEAKPYGELIVAGDNGSLFHYHPNPDLNFKTQDGRWMSISEKEIPTKKWKNLFIPEKNSLVAKTDFDGDSVHEDGNSSGYVGDQPCPLYDANGNPQSLLNCDDNCPLSPNKDQKDTDKDGIGDVCDLSEEEFSQNTLEKKIHNAVFVQENSKQILYAGVGVGGFFVLYYGADGFFTDRFKNYVVEKINTWFPQKNAAFEEKNTSNKTPIIFNKGVCNDCKTRYFENNLNDIAISDRGEVVVVGNDQTVFKASLQSVKSKKPLEKYTCQYPSEWGNEAHDLTHVVYHPTSGYYVTSGMYVGHIEFSETSCNIENVLIQNPFAIWKDAYVDQDLRIWFVGTSGVVSYLDLDKKWHFFEPNDQESWNAVVATGKGDTVSVWIVGNHGRIMNGFLE